MPSLSILLPLLGASFPLAANAWGTLGHETVAYIATNFVASDTKTWAQDILGDTSADYLASVATWADTYRYTAAGKYSAPFHFIDAEDSPPSSCSVDYSRDCGSGGCSISALANYTKRVTSSSSTSANKLEALKFLVHITGDLHQPLHDEALEVGGNDIDVTFNGTSTNLHHIWDTNMPEAFRGGYTLADAKAWAADLTTDIKTGTYESQKASWITDIDVTDVVTTTLPWAQEANAYVCSTVLPKGASAVENVDLDGAYYKTATPVIEIQLARAGVRLAAFLDAIVASQSSSDKRSVAVEEDLSGLEFLPEPRRVTRAQLARMAVGYGCKH